jgi:hypothetical protein
MLVLDPRSPAARSVAKASSVLLAAWLLVLPMTGLLRVTLMPDDPSSSASMLPLEEEVHPADVTGLALFNERGGVPDPTGSVPHVDGVRQLSHHGEVPHHPPWI